MKRGETTGATNEALAASEAVRSARRAPSKVGWLANEKRLSCAAVLCCSQKQFYYDGRRQLQPLGSTRQMLQRALASSGVTPSLPSSRTADVEQFSPSCQTS